MNNRPFPIHRRIVFPILLILAAIILAGSLLSAPRPASGGPSAGSSAPVSHVAARVIAPARHVSARIIAPARNIAPTATPPVATFTNTPLPPEYQANQSQTIGLAFGGLLIVLIVVMGVALFMPREPEE